MARQRINQQLVKRGTSMRADRGTPDILGGDLTPVPTKSPDADKIPETRRIRASAGIAGATHQISPNGVASSRLFPDVPVEDIKQTKVAQGKAGLDPTDASAVPVHGVVTSANGSAAPRIGAEVMQGSRPRIGLQKAAPTVTHTTEITPPSSSSSSSSSTSDESESNSSPSSDPGSTLKKHFEDLLGRR